MISGFLDMSMGPETNLIYLWRPQKTTNNSRKRPKGFQKYFWGNSNISEIAVFEKMDEMGPANPDNPPNNFLKILDMGAGSSRKHEMEFW